jgi:hypothetical protein
MRRGLQSGLRPGCIISETVITGLVPVIRVDGRVKPGYDELGGDSPNAPIL